MATMGDDRELQLTSFLVDPETRRGPSEPSIDQTRLLWLFVTLLQSRHVDFLSYHGVFHVSERTYKRDIAKLRKIGQFCRFKLSPQKQGRIELLDFPGHTGSLSDRSSELADLVRVVSEAMGGPVKTALSPLAENGKKRGEPFLRVVAPRLVESSTVARVYEALERAAKDRARIEFRYLSTNRQLSTRVVEPYAAVLRSGRFYLVAYDPAPRKGWRRFALDSIQEPLTRAGTFKPRPIPDDVIPADAVGLFTKGPAVPVTIALSAVVAASATSRLWQRGQQVVERDDGSATITLRVEEPDEAIRWALGFGAEAQVVAPPSAVARARSIAERIFEGYNEKLGERSSRRSA
jgi:predicted DNA-binding transcriptional regulator YafY